MVILDQIMMISISSQLSSYAICPAFVFRYDPEKKNAGPEGGPNASGQRLQMGYFTNFWKTHGDCLGKSWISWDPFLEWDLLGFKSGYLGEKKRTNFSSMILPLKPPCIPSGKLT